MTAIFKSPAAAAEVLACYRDVLRRWPVPYERIHLPTREGETFVVACGPKDAPPVVLLHGSQANTAVWMFDAALWSQRYRVYAVDMIGEPGLSAPSRPPLASEAHALWLDDVMRGLALERAAFVGVSLGGWLALDYATRRPERIDRLALLCPAGIGRQKNFLLKAAPLLLLGPWGLRKMREMVLGPPPRDLPERAKPLAALLGSLLSNVRPRIVRIPVFDDAALASLSVPMLVIVGGKDVLLNSGETRDRLTRTLPHAEVRYLPEARHYIPGQAQEIFDFLQQMERTDTREAHSAAG